MSTMLHGITYGTANITARHLEDTLDCLRRGSLYVGRPASPYDQQHVLDLVALAGRLAAQAGLNQVECIKLFTEEGGA